MQIHSSMCRFCDINRNTGAWEIAGADQGLIRLQALSSRPQLPEGGRDGLTRTRTLEGPLGNKELGLRGGGGG